MIFKIFLILILIGNSVSAQTIISGKSKVIDGDTIHINSYKIRLHGIDAPEAKQKCLINNKIWNCGIESTEALKKIILNEVIKCNIIDKDRYDRFIGICFVNNLNVNKYMVKNGWAIAYRYYSLDYVKEEDKARKNKVGIWQGKFEEPYIFRKKQKK